jgi:hypothetical protein
LPNAALALFRANESEQLFKRLFQITCVFQRSAAGILAMKKARIHAKLVSFEATIKRNLDRGLSQRQLEK